jgi:hypothetical protein
MKKIFVIFVPDQENKYHNQTNAKHVKARECVRIKKSLNSILKKGHQMVKNLNLKEKLMSILKKKQEVLYL